MSPLTRPARLTRPGLTGATLTVVTLAALGLSACSSTPAASTPNPPTTTPTIIKGETLKTETHKPERSESPSSTKSSGQANSGFDAAAFQSAMSALGVPATGATSGKGTTGAGAMSYTLQGGAQGIGQITCEVTSQAGSDSQSDQDALTLAKPFLVDCGSFSQYGELKTQAASYITTNLPTLQGESMVTTTVGAIMLKVGRAGPGNYFVTTVNGG